MRSLRGLLILILFLHAIVLAGGLSLAETKQPLRRKPKRWQKRLRTS